MAAYISGMGAVLPNEPVGNNDMERLLGQVGGTRSRARALVLRSNGIRSRHYAIDPVTGAATHNNRTLTAAAVRQLCENTGFALSDLECLVTGTSAPDQMMPNHAVMVHAELGTPPCETVSTAGVCCAGLTALKYGYLSVLAGASKHAVVTASEVGSSVLRAANYGGAHVDVDDDRAAARLTANPAVAFEADFLRWMLSDGAAASLITPTPQGPGVSLRIDWIEIISMAHLTDACMYWGAEKLPDGRLIGWRELGDLGAARAHGHFQLRQDVRQLNNLAPQLVGDCFDILCKRRDPSPDQYDWFLPHYSSNYFREPLERVLQERRFVIPSEKWFTNLTDKGNTGSASIFIMLEELLNGGRLEPGQQILCLVPESSRFTYGFMQLTVE